jgi:hypothetical protein
MCEDIFHHACRRHFLTTEEKIKHLQYYKKWLENETKGVQEVINKLEPTST